VQVAAPPSATTLAGTGVTTTGATLDASLNAEGSDTSVAFVYGTDPTLTTGTTTTTAQDIGSGTSDVAVTAAVSGFQPGMTYYDQVVATSAGGTTKGAILPLVLTTQSYLYVGDVSGNQVLRFDATTGAVVNPVPYLSIPKAEGLGGTNTRLAVSSGPATIDVYDVSTGADNPPLVQTISDPAHPLRIAFSLDGTKLYVTGAPNGSTGELDEFDFATRQLLNSITVPDGCWGVAVDPANGLVYFTTGWATGTGGAVMSANANLSNVTTVEPAGAHGATGLVGITFQQSDGSFYVVNGGNGDPNDDFVLHYNADGSFRDVVSTSGMPAGSLYNAFDTEIGPDGNLYVTSQSGACVVKFDSAADTFDSIFVHPKANGLQTAKTLHFSTNIVGVPTTMTPELATGVTSTSATLSASVNPQGRATIFSFVYGTDPALTTGTTTTTLEAIGSGTIPVAVTAPVTGLVPGTTYYGQVVATSPGGTTDGTITSFTTLVVVAPTATTDAAGYTSTAATLNGSVNPEGSDTTVTFVYGTDPTLTTGTTTTTAEDVPSDTSAVPVTAALTGLQPGTTYYDQVIATNAGGTSNGAIVSFTTLGRPTAATAKKARKENPWDDTPKRPRLHGQGCPS